MVKFGVIYISILEIDQIICMDEESSMQTQNSDSEIIY